MIIISHSLRLQWMKMTSVFNIWFWPKRSSAKLKSYKHLNIIDSHGSRFINQALKENWIKKIPPFLYHFLGSSIYKNMSFVLYFGSLTIFCSKNRFQMLVFAPLGKVHTIGRGRSKKSAIKARLSRWNWSLLYSVSVVLYQVHIKQVFRFFWVSGCVLLDRAFVPSAKCVMNN